MAGNDGDFNQLLREDKKRGHAPDFSPVHEDSSLTPRQRFVEGSGNPIHELITNGACGANPDQPYSSSTPGTIAYLGIVAAQRPEPGLEKAIDCAKVNVTRIVERLDYDQFAAAATAVIKKPGGTINDGCLVFHELRFNNKSDDGPGLSRAQPQESPQNTPDEHRPGPIMPPMFRDVQFSKSGEPLAPAVSRPGSQIQKGDPPIEFKVCPREQ